MATGPFRARSIVAALGTILVVGAFTALLLLFMPRGGASRGGPAPKAPPTPPPTLPGPPLVAVNPGHNGNNWRHTSEINRRVAAGRGTQACDTEGTTTLSGYTEAAYNFDVASALAPVLSGRGLRVLLTRTSNDGWGPCVDERAAMANRARAAVSISIHADGWKLGRGFYVLYAAPPDGSPDASSPLATAIKRLALDVRDAYAQGTGMPHANYAGHDGLLAEPWPTLYQVPEVLIECGNMRNGTDAALLADPAFRSRVVQALANGIAAFLATR
jgi:N-acetylmuramoyl-L-alanine amidase